MQIKSFSDYLFSARLRLSRQHKRKFTQAEMVDKILKDMPDGFSLHLSKYSRWESGSQKPSKAIQNRVREIIG